MAGEWKRVDDKTVLAYLKSKRSALDQAIAALEGKAGNISETFDRVVPMRRSSQIVSLE